MSDEIYQAAYTAIRQRLGDCNIGDAVERAIAQANLSHYANMAAQEVSFAASQHVRPSAVYRPSLSIDGNQWCALYGANLMDGVAGFGDSPAKAMADFDARWLESLPIREIAREELRTPEAGSEHPRKVLAHRWFKPSKPVDIKMGSWRDGDTGKPSREREEAWLRSVGFEVQRAYK